MSTKRRETFFKKVSSGGELFEGAEKEESAAIEKKLPAAASKTPPPLYGDKEVCRALCIRRREIARARTKQARGKDWDAIDLHAGMTTEWCMAKANELGKSVSVMIGMQPIKKGDCVASCKLIGGFPNCTKAAVQMVADPEQRRIVKVKDTRMMVPGEIFDVYGDTWTAELNGGIVY